MVAININNRNNQLKATANNKQQDESPSSSPVQRQKREKQNSEVCESDRMEETYDKLAERLRRKLPEIPDSEQYWVAIAGGPGSGKSTTAGEVAKRLNSAENKELCVVLPMDGFHYSKEELKQMDPPEARQLLYRRGAPWTMDAEQCVDSLRQAKEDHFGDLPSYNRRLSDPEPDAIHLEPHHKIVLVEGLYLLWKEDPRWEGLLEIWDEGWFVRCANREEQRDRLIKRSTEHWNPTRVETYGPLMEGVTNKVDGNDAKNMDMVASSEKFADVIVISKN